MKLIKLKKLTRVAMMAALCSATLNVKSESGALENTLKVDENNQWFEKAQKPVPFQSNTHYQARIDELDITLDTRGVVFGYQLDNIAAIQPGGFLKMRSLSDTGSITLDVFADSDGKLGFEYRVNHLMVRHQGAAQQFLTEILNKLVDNGAHDWRVNSLRYLSSTNEKQVASMTEARKLTEQKLRAVANGADGRFSYDDIVLANELLVSESWQREGQKIWTYGDDNITAPFDEFMITNNANFARLDNSGQLNIYQMLDNGQQQALAFNLNNDVLIGAFLTATGQPYRIGNTERKLADFLLRVHWQRTEAQLQWHQLSYNGISWVKRHPVSVRQSTTRVDS